jgi:hypothetical protein
MSNINLNISFNPKVVIAVLAIIGIAAYAYKIPETKAQASSTLTGKYGCVDNPNSLPYVTAFTGRPEATYLNNLYFLDFDNKTQSGIEQVITNFNGSNPRPFRSFESGTISINVSSGQIPGMINVTNSGGYNITFIAVNSGNTLLGIDTQVGNEGQPANSVCQKV